MRIDQLPVASSITNNDTLPVNVSGTSQQLSIGSLTNAIRDNVYGAPLTASTSSAMTDQTKVYVYTGTTGGGYTNGHWYYYNGSAWTDGGAYNSSAVQTDTSLTLSGVPADAKATGDAFTAQSNNFKDALSSASSVERQYANGVKDRLYLVDGDFVRGAWLGNGTFTENSPVNRIATKNKIAFDEYTTLIINPGFRIRPIVFNRSTGAWISSNPWTTGSYLITRNDVSYAFNISRETDISSEVADIAYFAKQVYVNAPVQAEMMIARKGRFLDEFAKDSVDRRLYSQSCTYRDSMYYLCGNNQNTTQTITVWSSTGVLQKTVRRTDLFHANDITSTPDYLIVATGSSNIAVLDRSDTNFATVKTIDVSGIVNTAFAISHNMNNDVYFMGSDVTDSTLLTIAKLDIANSTYTKVCSVPIPNSLTPQGFTVNGRYAYLLFNMSNCVYKVNMDLSLIVGYYSIDEADSLHPVGEPETLFKVGNNIYLLGVPYFRSTEYRANSEIAMSQIYITNLVNPLDEVDRSNYMTALSRTTLLVNGNEAHAWNPRNNFRAIEEAAFIGNFRGSATFRLENTTRGVCELNDGVYSVVAKTQGDTQAVDMLIVKNCDIILGDLNVGTLIATNSRIDLIDCSVATTTNTYSVINNAT